MQIYIYKYVCRWYEKTPNTVVFFCGMVVITQLLEATLTRYCGVYRDHMSFAQRRKFIFHAWATVVDIIGFTLQCIAYMPALFTGTTIDPHNAHILAALACLVMVRYMFDLAYTIPNTELLCHHLSSVLGLVAMVFVVDDTHEVQTFLMFSTILLLFETLSATQHIAMILHRLWASPVAHPVRHVWAGRFMLFAACWSVVTKLGVYAFITVRFIQVARLGPGVGVATVNEKPVSQLRGGVGGTWFWVMVVLIPVILIGLGFAHFRTWVVLFKLGLRHRRRSPAAKARAVHNVSDLQLTVVDEDKGSEWVTAKTGYQNDDSSRP